MVGKVPTLDLTPPLPFWCSHSSLSSIVKAELLWPWWLTLLLATWSVLTRLGFQVPAGFNFVSYLARWICLSDSIAGSCQVLTQHACLSFLTGLERHMCLFNSLLSIEVDNMIGVSIMLWDGLENLWFWDSSFFWRSSFVLLQCQNN